MTLRTRSILASLLAILVAITIVGASVDVLVGRHSADRWTPLSGSVRSRSGS